MRPLATLSFPLNESADRGLGSVYRRVVQLPRAEVGDGHEPGRVAQGQEGALRRSTAIRFRRYRYVPLLCSAVVTRATAEGEMRCAGSKKQHTAEIEAFLNDAFNLDSTN